MSGIEKPSILLTPDDLAEVSGYSIRRIHDLRTRTRRAQGQVGPEFSRIHTGPQGVRVFYTVSAVRAWLTVKRPEKLSVLDAWVAARTLTVEV